MSPGSVVYLSGVPLVLLTDWDGTAKWFGPDWMPAVVEDAA